jgi:hypothetical protein
MLQVITRLRRRHQAWATARMADAPALPAEDAPDMLPEAAPDTAGETRHICQEIAFTYTDMFGRSSRRRVNIHRARRKGADLYIQGRCYRRNAMRGFWASRMDDLVDIATGAVIPAPVSGYLAAHVIGLDGMPAPVRRELAVLAAFITADGETQPAEMALATAHVARRFPDLAGDAAGQAALAAHFRRLALSAYEFEDALAAIARADLAAVELLRATGAEILAADGVLHQDEIDILDDFDRVVVDARG